MPRFQGLQINQICSQIFGSGPRHTASQDFSRILLPRVSLRPAP